MPRSTITALERDTVVLACAISAGVHGALTREHLGEGAGAGLGFLASSLVLAGLVVALTRLPRSTIAVAFAGLALAGLLAGYGLAVTTGVPLLHPHAEPIAAIASATKAVEAFGLVAAMHFLWRDRHALALVIPRPKGTTP